MSNRYPYTITPLGDAALLIDFGNRMDKALNQKVLQLFLLLKNKAPSFIYDVVPAYSSLVIHYHAPALFEAKNEVTAFEKVVNMVQVLIEEGEAKEEEKRRHLAIPVCYAPRFGPDLEELSFRRKLSIEEIIHLHTRPLYRVYMIGFLPGFAYMGEVDERMACPRKEKPRQNVVAGSVGIAGLQTGIYPLESPGGWQIIGRTPLSLFDPGRAQPSLLEPGDEITFYSISEDEFNHH